jgi:8-oxo-dGTP pyrophosphatase MutT (NUDIX family)
MMPKKTQIHGTVAIIVFDKYKQHILLSKRLKEPAKDVYAVAGGKIDLGESPFQAAKRELQEETGMVVDDSDLIATNDVTSYYWKDLNIQHYCYWFYCRSTVEHKDTDVHEFSEKGEKWEWCNIQNLLKDALKDEKELFPETVNIITKIRQGSSISYLRHYEM